MEEQDFKNIDPIERYHLGEMQAAEKTAFEQQLQNDPELARENAEYLALISGIELRGEQDLRRKLGEVEAQLEAEGFFREAKPETKTAALRPEMTLAHRRPNRLWWAVAAALAVVAAAVFFLNKNPAVPAADAFAAFYKPETRVLGSTLDRLESSGLASADRERQDSLAFALSAYEQKRYDEAIRQLETYLTVYPDDKTASLYLGLSLLHLGSLPETISKLAPLAADNSFEYRTTARWYLALALVKKGDSASIARANTLLAELHNDPKSGYFREAEEFMKMLEDL